MTLAYPIPRSRLRCVAVAAFAAIAGLSFGLSSVAFAQRQPTSQTSIGVFYMPGAPRETTLWRAGDEGKRLFLQGRVLSQEGLPVSNALVEMWHADAAGGVDESRYRSAQPSKGDGRFGIKTVLPGHIARAIDYPVFAPRHVHIVVTHPGYETLVSLIYFKGDERLAGTPHPELAIALEKTDAEVGEVLFGRVEIVLRAAGDSRN